MTAHLAPNRDSSMFANTSSQSALVDSSLEDLMAGIARGDHRAFAALYDRTSSRVFRTVQRCIVDPSQAEEVVQEVYLEVWSRAAHFDPRKGSAATWITVIARRRGIDRVRASQSSRERDLRVGARAVDVDYDDAAESAGIAIEFDRVVRAMGSLSDLQRETVELSFRSGLSNREVASLLHVPVGTVKTRLRDGLIRLRTTLGTD